MDAHGYLANDSIYPGPDGGPATARLPNSFPGWPSEISGVQRCPDRTTRPADRENDARACARCSRPPARSLRGISFQQQLQDPLLINSKFRPAGMALFPCPSLVGSVSGTGNCGVGGELGCPSRCSHSRVASCPNHSLPILVLEDAICRARVWPLAVAAVRMAGLFRHYGFCLLRSLAPTRFSQPYWRGFRRR